jgi:Domain of Unknown Function with PDB structure (DUF3857)
MFSIKTPTFLLLFCLFSFNIFAQKPAPIEFGKISMEDLKMKSYAKDTSAEAIILCDYGENFYSFANSNPEIIHRRHVRIKILKKSGFSRATVKIGYYSANDNSNERVNNIKAVTYNLEAENQVNHVLDEASIFEDRANKNYYYKTFTLPQVREGSVIEYSYDIESGQWYTLRTWDFQKSIPVVWSELRAVIPQYFDFNITLQSTIPLFVNENEQGEENFMRGSIRDKYLRYRFVMKDISSLKEEPYLTTIENFRSKLSFELAATYFPDQAKRDYSQTWEALNQTLLTHDNFGKQIKKFDQSDDIAKLLKTQYKDTLSIAKAAFKYIQSTMKWNEEEWTFTSANLNKVYEKRTGNSAEINLMLIRLLRDCGIEANPVILSTRDNGKVSDLVLLDRFNYTIAHIVLANKDVLLDATNSYTTFGMLPIRCMNERGRLITRKNSRWIAIKPSPMHRTITMKTMVINPDQSIKGTSRTSFAAHSAVDFRTSVIAKGKDSYLSDYKKNRPNQTIESIQIINLDTLEDLAELETKTTLNEAYTIAGNRIYFSPMLGEGEEKNPFKALERKYPVDFGVPQEETYIATFSIPEGYIVEDMPKPDNISLPNDGGKFTFLCMDENGFLKITSKITLKRAIYSEEEYHSLREFYNRIVGKHAEQVVFKKK